jgi:ISXO2-like transposase domain
VVAPGTTIYADESSSWDGLHAHYDARRINHSIAFHDEGVDTNQAESFFSRMRRAEIGQHHHIGIHLHQYAGEMAWREDNRRKPNGTCMSQLPSSPRAASLGADGSPCPPGVSEPVTELGAPSAHPLSNPNSRSGRRPASPYSQGRVM